MDDAQQGGEEDRIRLDPCPAARHAGSVLVGSAGTVPSLEEKGVTANPEE